MHIGAHHSRQEKVPGTCNPAKNQHNVTKYIHFRYPPRKFFKNISLLKSVNEITLKFYLGVTRLYSNLDKFLFSSIGAISPNKIKKHSEHLFQKGLTVLQILVATTPI